MRYLEGEQIKIDTKTLNKLIGVKVKFLLKRNVDYSGRGWYSPDSGIITDVYRKHVDFGNGCYESFSSIIEIVKL